MAKLFSNFVWYELIQLHDIFFTKTVDSKIPKNCSLHPEIFAMDHLILNGFQVYIQLIKSSNQFIRFNDAKKVCKMGLTSSFDRNNRALLLALCQE